MALVDGYLAGAVLGSLVLNALVGWWWADPLAGLVIVYYGIKEGLQSWYGLERSLRNPSTPRMSARGRTASSSQYLA